MNGFEADVAPAQATGDLLGQLTAWVQRIRAAQAEVDRLTLELEQATAAYNELTMRQVPDAMEAAGLTDLTLQDGAKLVVKDGLNVSITETNRAAAYAWLRERGHDLAIKNVLAVDLRPLPEKDRHKLLTLLEGRMHVEPTVSEAIHPATLKSIIGSMLEHGVDVPPSINVFQFKRAVVKERKA